VENTWKRYVSGHAVVALFLAALVANAAAYSSAATTEVLRFDQWRFLGILEKHFEGSLAFEDLWAPEAAARNMDRNLGYHLFFIANAEALGLDTTAERWLGLVVNLLIVVLLYRAFERYAGDEVDPKVLSWAFLPLALVCFSLGKWWAYAYSLAAFKMHWIILLFLVDFWLLDRILVGRSDRYGLYLAVLVASLLLFGGGALPAALAAAVVAVAVAWAVGAVPRRRVLWAGGSTLLGGFLVLALYLRGLGAGNDRLMRRLDLLADHPLGTGEFVLLGLGRSAGESLVLWDGRLAVMIGAAVLVLHVWCFHLFLRHRMYESTYIPLMLMVYALVYVALTALLRLHAGGDVTNAAVPRYVVNSSLGLVGCLWILGWRFAAVGGRIRTATGASYVAVVALTLAAQIHATSYRWDRIHNVRSRYERALRIVAKDPADLRPEDFRVLGCRDPEWCLDGLDLLRREQLNVFRAGADPSGE
jgi:hypothetical protein